jgi:hypothetical protein
MDFEDIEKNIIFKYWETLIRKNISNIQTNKFIKKPYLEDYIIKLSDCLDKNKLYSKIIELLECNEITNEELILFINNNIELSNKQKKFIEKFYFQGNDNDNDNDNDNENENEKVSFEIINYQIKYFKFYNTVTELLFDNVFEDNELYNFILIFIKNKKNEINKYLKKNFKFKLFYHYLNDLYESFNNMINILIKKKLYEKIEEKEILNLFLKNLFTNWYNIYKKDILENKVNDKIKGYVIKNNILSRILCLPMVNN